MKKRLLFVAPVAFAILLLGACGSAGAGGGGDDEDWSWEWTTIGNSELAATRTFNAQHAVTGAWYQLDADLLATGESCAVYVEDGAAVNTATAEAIAAEFDANIHGLINDNFAAECDVDGNGKVIILLLDIQDGYSGSGGYVAGYFDATHLFSTDTYSVSNEAEMLFMDINPVVAGSADFYATAAHEFQHLVNFANTYAKTGSGQDVWINEGLSAGAEYLYAGAQIQDRIDWYNNDSLGSLAWGNNFFVWSGFFEGESSDTVLDNYATVYLFFQWLRIHADNDTQIYKEILDSPYRDYRAVTAAAASYIHPDFSSWSVLLRTWMGANLLCLDTGRLGYEGEIEVAAPVMSPQEGAEWPFSPGEGIFAYSTGWAFTPVGGGSGIKYAGFTTGTSFVDTTGSTYEGEVALTYNSDSDNGGADKLGFIADAGTTPVASVRSLRSAGFAAPASYPVSVLMAPGGGLAAGSHKPQAGGARKFDKKAGKAWSGR